ncbi:MAG: hypothetical protein ACK6AH_14945 [Gemmatimonadota bacterium]
MRRLWFAAVALGQVLSACARRPSVWVFSAPWDPRSDQALANGVAWRATIVSGWIALDTLGGVPSSLYRDALLADSAGRPPRFALVTSYRGDRFHPEAVRALGRDSLARRRAAAVLEQILRDGAYGGVVLDFEALAPADTGDLARVVEALGAAARRGGARTVAIAVPALDTAAYPARILLQYTDRLLVMLYDLHWSGSAPGPVAARDWARQALRTWVDAASPARVVAAFPTYGYHWRPGAPTDVIGWGDAQRLARESGQSLVRDSASGALRLHLGERGEAWIADGLLAAGMTADARALGVRTVALWRLGLEDPALWTALGFR